MRALTQVTPNSVTLDDDDLFYMDFKNNATVLDSKVATLIQYENAYKEAELCRIICNKDIHRWKPDPDVRRTKGR